MTCECEKGQILDVEVSREDPPRAWYTVKCLDCGEFYEGHADELFDTSWEESNLNRNIETAEDIRDKYVAGRIDEIEMEKRLERVFGLNVHDEEN